MKRPARIQYGVLMLGALFVIVGMCMIVKPVATVIIHPGSGIHGVRSGGPELITKEGSQVRGAIATLVGAGLISAALYQGRT
jgi:hypothetical protein